MLEQLDSKWTTYEKGYVFELMVIETDARRFIVDAIQLETKLTDYEALQKKKGNKTYQSSKEYNEKRAQFITNISEINAVANV